MIRRWARLWTCPTAQQQDRMVASGAYHTRRRSTYICVLVAIYMRWLPRHVDKTMGVFARAAHVLVLWRMPCLHRMRVYVSRILPRR